MNQTKSPSSWWQLVRFGFRLLYNEMAWTYDSVSWVVSLGEWRSWQRAALKHLNLSYGSRVLELAHGTANLHLDLFAAGYLPVGLDFSPYMGTIARRKLVGYNLPYKLVRARAQSLPFASRTFPAVISTFPTEFIVDPATISEVYRVLNPGGRLVFVPNGTLTKGGLAKKAIEIAYTATGQRDPSANDSPELEQAWPLAIRSRFAAAGFTLSQVLEPCKISMAQVVIAQKPL
jgi:ubiquinone/menaquinone biosynthesis C-methylase UbiE